VTLWIDDQPLTSLDAPPYQAWWTLSPGAHKAIVSGVSEDGKTVQSPPVHFEVLDK
jgi:hypothetical protein